MSNWNPEKVSDIYETIYLLYNGGEDLLGSEIFLFLVMKSLW